MTSSQRSTIDANPINRNLFDSMEDTSVEMTPAIADYSHPVTVPFGQISECKSKDDIGRMIALIFSEKLDMNDDKKLNLVTALQKYFAEAGIENESQFTSMDPDD